jgi:arylformamidase
LIASARARKLRGAMTEKIYRDYTREELDAQYTNLSSPEAEAALKAVRERSARNVAALAPERGLTYGPQPDQRFDLYRASANDGGSGGPGLLFFHGGQWQRGDTGVFAAWADVLVDRGVTFVDGTTTQIPNARLPEIIDQAVALVRHVRDNAAKLGIAAGRLAVSGQSSGAHLVASALVRLANEDDLDGIACALPFSGNYDLRPLMLSYRADYLQLSEAETIACSPLLTLDAPLPPTLVACGGAETDEFQRQSHTFHAALEARGPAELRVIPGANHFTVYDDLYRPGTPSWRFLETHLGLSAASEAAE